MPIHTSELKTILSDVVLGESPRWHDQRLWFSDWGSLQLIATDVHGSSEVIVDGGLTVPFCFDWLPDGKLLIISGSDGLLLRMAADRSLVTHVELTGMSDKPWNDMVVDGRGNAYVGNIGFDFPGGQFAPGTLALVTPDGSSRQVAEGLAFPNGMVVTPDNCTLIVAESYANQLTAFEIATDGSLSGRRIWAPLGDGVPDGICLDAENAVWYADVPNKRCVRVREGGEVLQVIEADRGCFACALGGEDRRTLFIVAAQFPPDLATRTGKIAACEVNTAGIR